MRPYSVRNLIAITITRLPSSRMHTAHLLTISQHTLCRGVYVPGCLLAHEGFLPSGRCLPRGGCVVPGGCLPGGYIPACNWADPPPCGQTDTCENITFANFVYRRKKSNTLLYILVWDVLFVLNVWVQISLWN